MAGTVTTVETVHGSAKKIAFAWTSDAAGAADGVSANVFDGKIVGLATIPAGGGAAPTDNYDVAIKDADGHDVLLGKGVDRDTANTEYVDGSVLGAIAGTKLTLAVTNAGNAKQGTAIVWVR